MIQFFIPSSLNVRLQRDIGGKDVLGVVNPQGSPLPLQGNVSGSPTQVNEELSVTMLREQGAGQGPLVP